ncbi:MAG TPA: thioredoxin [Planctomycetota bacterium]|nr:thioredoxin [Planctomycetota bacterium]
MTAGTISVTDSDFKAQVEDAKGLTVVDFWAEWCGPCKMLAPTLDKLAKEYTGKVKFTNVDTQNNMEVPSRFGIQQIPTLLMFKDGKMVDSQLGNLPYGKLKSWIDGHLSRG